MLWKFYNLSFFSFSTLNIMVEQLTWMTQKANLIWVKTLILILCRTQNLWSKIIIDPWYNQIGYCSAQSLCCESFTSVFSACQSRQDDCLLDPPFSTSNRITWPELSIWLDEREITRSKVLTTLGFYLFSFDNTCFFIARLNFIPYKLCDTPGYLLK